MGNRLILIVTFYFITYSNCMSQHLFIDVGLGYTKTNLDLPQYSEQATLKPFYAGAVIGFGESGIFGLGIDYMLLNNYTFKASSNNNLVYKEAFTDNYFGLKMQFYIPFADTDDEALPLGLVLGGGCGITKTKREITFENGYKDLDLVSIGETYTFNDKFGYNYFLGTCLGPFKLLVRNNLWTKERSDGVTFNSDFLSYELGLNLKIPL